MNVLDAVESFDGKLLFVMKSGSGAGPSNVIGSLWSIPVAGGEEKLIVKTIISGWWTLVEKGIYYLEAPGRLGSPIKFFDLATSSTRDIAASPKIRISVRPGLTATRDGKFVLWEQVDLENTDLMLVENLQ